MALSPILCEEVKLNEWPFERTSQKLTVCIPFNMGTWGLETVPICKWQTLKAKGCVRCSDGKAKRKKVDLLLDKLDLYQNIDQIWTSQKAAGFEYPKSFI